MASALRFIAFFLLMIVSQNGMYCEESGQSSSDLDDSASIPLLPSGKRQHAILRFGKRPAGGHSLIHFGKREGDPPSKSPTHSFLYFGKRSPTDGQTLPDFLKYLQKNRDSSYKRGHAIMRFGKRGGQGHNMIRFGKREDDDDEGDYYSPEDEYDDQKRNGGHSMMYFGKRDGHSMMYFGKRAKGHAILSFGKREPDEQDKRGAHSMIHFGKREYDDDDMDEDKRAHAMIHFGKREGEDDSEDEISKRGGAHSMIHFGKRDPTVEDMAPLFWFPESSEKRQHNLLRFGKKMDNFRKGSHSMIHFGKRENPKNAHAMIHFGKRSVDPDDVPPTNKSEKIKTPSQSITRMKREIDASHGPLMALIQPEEEGIDESNNNIAYYPPEDIFSPFEIPGEQDGYSDEYPAKKSDTSKNVFLRFG